MAKTEVRNGLCRRKTSIAAASQDQSNVWASVFVATQPVIAQTAIRTGGPVCPLENQGARSGDGELVAYQARPAVEPAARGAGRPEIRRPRRVPSGRLPAPGVAQAVRHRPELFCPPGRSAADCQHSASPKDHQKTPDAQVMSDLDACLLPGLPAKVPDTGCLAVTGFCQGYCITWLYSTHNPAVKAPASPGTVGWAATTVRLEASGPIWSASLKARRCSGLYGGLIPASR